MAACDHNNPVSDRMLVHQPASSLWNRYLTVWPCAFIIRPIRTKFPNRLKASSRSEQCWQAPTCSLIRAAATASSLLPFTKISSSSVEM